MEVSEWEKLMIEWNETLFQDEVLMKHLDDNLKKRKWLGNPGATEDQLDKLEQRLGIELPPDYKNFLRFSNGWQGRLTSSIYNLWSTEEIQWLSVRNQGWIDDEIRTFSGQVSVEEHMRYGVRQFETTYRAEYLKAALEISDWGDASILLLNPEIKDEEGNWEAWEYATWYPGAFRFPSFAELMYRIQP